jgi:hypothetical protein
MVRAVHPAVDEMNFNDADWAPMPAVQAGDLRAPADEESPKLPKSLSDDEVIFLAKDLSDRLHGAEAYDRDLRLPRRRTDSSVGRYQSSSVVRR